MEYQDFYDIADYFNNLNCQVYTEKEIATNAYEYKSEYDYSMRKGKPTRTMIELCKLCCEDMSNWEWRTQSCTVSSIEECKRIYGLDNGDVEYEILEVKEA